MLSLPESGFWTLVSRKVEEDFLFLDNVQVNKTSILIKPSKRPKFKTEFHSESSSNWIYSTAKNLVEFFFPDRRIYFAHVSVHVPILDSYQTICCFEYDSYEQFKHIFKKYVPALDTDYKIQFYHAKCPENFLVLIHKPSNSTGKLNDFIPDGIVALLVDKNNNNPFKDKVVASNVHVYRLHWHKNGNIWEYYIIPQHLVSKLRQNSQIDLADADDFHKKRKCTFYPSQRQKVQKSEIIKK